MATIENINYNKQDKTLKVIFGYQPDVEYTYSNFPAGKARDFQNAESKGKYFHQHIRPFDYKYNPRWETI